MAANPLDLPTWLLPESIEDLTTRLLMAFIILGFLYEKIVPGKRVEKLEDTVSKLTDGINKMADAQETANRINDRAIELLGERRREPRAKTHK